MIFRVKAEVDGDNIEQIVKIKSVFDKLLAIASRGVVTRLLVFFLFIGLIPTVYFVAVDYLQQAVDGQDNVHSRVTKLNQDLRLMQSAISYLELCLDSKETNQTNRDWYCATGVRLYKDQASRGSPVWMETLLKRNAIPAMIIQVEYLQDLAKEDIEKAQISMSHEEFLLNALLKSYVEYVIIALIFFVAGYVGYQFFRNLYRRSE